ncbi:hypothetical protein [Corallococcus coralloides]|nr:hypothetical protein [Corallococcus coralloides]
MAEKPPATSVKESGPVIVMVTGREAMGVHTPVPYMSRVPV